MKRCALHGKRRCFGRLQDHHVLSRQRIKSHLRWLRALPWFERVRRRLLDPMHLPTEHQAIADPRNLLKLCVRHHELFTKGFAAIER